VPPGCPGSPKPPVKPPPNATGECCWAATPHTSTSPSAPLLRPLVGVLAALLTSEAPARRCCACAGQAALPGFM
jgi:hypothetical protein